MTKKKFRCSFCKKSFSKEQTLLTHSCIYRSRYNDRDNPDVILAFSIYKKIVDPASNKNIKFDKFIYNNLYTSLIKMVRWVKDNKLYNSQEYIDWLIKNSVNLNNWSKESTYQSFIYNFLQTETPERAVERFVLLAEEWATENNNYWQNVFTEANTNWICHKIQMGIISPWIYLGSESGKNMLTRLNNEQLEMVFSWLETISNVFQKKIRSKDLTWMNNLFT